MITRPLELGTPEDTQKRLASHMSAQDYALAQNTMFDQRWRLNNLYKIVVADTFGGVETKRQTMKLAWAQQALYDNMWYRNVVLKARQVYMTTFSQAYGLDLALFKPDTQVGVIAHTVDDAEAIFVSKIKFMYDNLPQFLKDAVPYTTGNKREIYFANGSRIRVATSLRSGTIDFLHVSEFAKICTQGRNKAEEVIAGSFGTVPQHGTIIVESTAEGPTGEFADMYWNAVELDKSVQRGDEERTPLDFKPFFFPCYKHPAYRIKNHDRVKIPADTKTYFDQFEEEHGLTFEPEYKAWYARQMNTSGDLMKQEFPNNDVEAFRKRSEGLIFAKEVAAAEDEGRIAPLPVMRGVPVDVALDLGRNDTTALWFYQTVGGWVNFIRSYEHRLVDVMHYVEILREYEQKYKYSYGTLYLPHDGSHLRIDSIAGSTRDIFKKHGFHVRVVKRPPRKNVSIDHARRAFSFCRFDKKETEKGVEALRAYSWKWDEVYDTFRDEPLHNRASNYADAFQTFAYKFRHPSDPPKVASERDSLYTYKRDQKYYQSSNDGWHIDTSHIII